MPHRAMWQFAEIWQNVSPSYIPTDTIFVIMLICGWAENTWREQPRVWQKKTAQFSGCHLQHKDLVFLNYKSATHRAALFSTLFVISNFPHGSRLKNRVNHFRLCITDEAKHRKRCYQCSGFSANIHHSCHKGQLGPFAQCDLVHTGQNRTMQYFCSHVCNTIQYRAISQSVPGSYRRNFFSWVSISHHSSIWYESVSTPQS